MDHEILAIWAQVAATLVVGAGQLVMIGFGLRQMRLSGERRDRQLDAMETAQRAQSERQGEALGKIGQALDRQGEMMTQALQGLQQQGEVLAELLRRRA